jgi:ribosome modulation factor
MKKVKKDSTGLAFKYGYQAAASEDIKESPYKDAECTKAWLKGYEQAVEDFDIV